jgi:DNA-directed RNA polymerase specialized sigma24 family protein
MALLPGTRPACSCAIARSLKMLCRKPGWTPGEAWHSSIPTGPFAPVPLIPLEHSPGEERLTLIGELDAAESVRDEIDPAIAQALGELTSEQQNILELHFSADLALTEIALVMGIPLGTVKSRLHRAVQALRAALGRDYSRAASTEELP